MPCSSSPGKQEGGRHGHRGGFSDSPPSSASPVPRGRCERGYTGARCERVDIFYLRGDRGQIVIISLIAAIVTLIVLVVCACLCSQYVAGTGRGAGREGAAPAWERILPASAGLGQVECGLPRSGGTRPLRVPGGARGIALGLETTCDPTQSFCKVKAEGGGAASLRCLIPLCLFVCLFVCLF